MAAIADFSITRETRPTVVALHCSGATGLQWRQLGSELGPRYSLVAPDLIGSGNTDGWTGQRAFTLSDEAASVVSVIDSVKRPVHLVGHSYGACVALRCAIERPSRIASLTLYEPAAFYVLKTMGPDGKSALKDIAGVARDVARSTLTGAYHAAARRFVEYWNGEGSWKAMRPEGRDGLVRYIPKACLEFFAGVNERTPLAAYRHIKCPVLLLQGEHTHLPMRMIARQLAKVMRSASLQTVYGASHMGPFTHAAAVSAMMANHIAAAEDRVPGGESSAAEDIYRAA
jgi:pimeloyl-ACP methyl ester carboxylesterase